MTTVNPFDLLGDNDFEDPSQLVVAGVAKLVEKPKKSAPGQAQPASKPAPAAKFPTKPPPPATAGEHIILSTLLLSFLLLI